MKTGSEVEAGPSGGRGCGLPAPAVAASPSLHPGQKEGHYQVILKVITR